MRTHTLHKQAPLMQMIPAQEKPKHTPGPWKRLDRHDGFRELTHITNGAHIICTLGTTKTDGSANHSANASLIASAPTMLEALQAIVDALGDQDSLLIEQAKDAIRKATQ